MDAKSGGAGLLAHDGPLLALPLVGLLTAMVSTQWGASLAKGLFPVMGVMGTASGRIMFAALFMTVALAPWKAKVQREDLIPILLYGGALAMMNLCFYEAISRIPLGITVTIEFIGPLGIALFASRSAMDFLWAIFALSGLALLAPWNPEAGHALDPAGIAFAIGAGVGWGSYIIAGRRVGRKHGTRVSALGMIVAALIALPFGLAEEDGLSISLSIVPLLAVVALFSSALPYTLEMLALRHIPTRTFGILMSLEPAVAALIGYLWLSEALTFRHWIAMLAIMAASAGATWTASRARAAAVEPCP